MEINKGDSQNGHLSSLLFSETKLRPYWLPHHFLNLLSINWRSFWNVQGLLHYGVLKCGSGLTILFRGFYFELIAWLPTSEWFSQQD